MIKVTVLGLGAMGSRMAANLLQANHAVTVWNRSEHRAQPLAKLGATVAKTPFAAVQGADVVISMVRDDEASRFVWFGQASIGQEDIGQEDIGKAGALSGMKADAIALESSTLTLSWTRTLAQAFQQKGIAFLDAPVAGSLPQAEAAQLIYLVGGSAETLAKVQPMLDILGGATHHAGKSGHGMAVKLAVNTLLAVQAATLAELMGLFQKCGLDEAQAVGILSATPVCSPAAKGLSAAMVARQFKAMFPIELVEKDLSYLTSTAHESEALAPMAQAAQQAFKQAIAHGKGADNITGIAQLYL